MSQLVVNVPDITLLWAGLFGLMAIVLASGPGLMRGKTGISIGDGDNPDLLLAMRRHGNFTEHVPLVITLFALLELNGAPDNAIHGMAVVLFGARLAHAFGLKADTIQGLGRLAGAGLTALVSLVASVWCIYLFFA